MILDGHIHIFDTSKNQEEFLQQLDGAGVAAAYRKLDVQDEVIENIFSGNLQRFLGISGK